MFFNKNLLLGGLAIVLLMFTACQDDNDGGGDGNQVTAKGNLRIEMTDAPIDDASVQGAFITVTDIQLDGQSIEGFNKTTFDVMAFQNGNTKVLEDASINTGSYSKMTLVLDNDTDMSGNAPGCYILDVNGQKQALASGTTNIILDINQEVEQNQSKTIVADFDLRKCIKRSTNSGQKYAFVTRTELESGIRVVAKTQSGTVRGNCQDAISGSDKVVVYAYKKGTFSDTETNGQGQSNIEFANAVTSAEVKSNGEYSLHFLEPGEYELKYFSYKENSNNEMTLNGTLLVNVLGSIDIGTVSVGASATVSIDVVATGVLPL